VDREPFRSLTAIDQGDRGPGGKFITVEKAPTLRE